MFILRLPRQFRGALTSWKLVWGGDNRKLLLLLTPGSLEPPGRGFLGLWCQQLRMHLEPESPVASPRDLEDPRMAAQSIQIGMEVRA